VGCYKTVIKITRSKLDPPAHSCFTLPIAPIRGSRNGEEAMSKETIKHKGYTVVKECMSGWYQWVIYAPKDEGICGGVREEDGTFFVEFFRNGEIVSFVEDSIVLGLEKGLNR
jgi:hypothetical protein